MLWRENNECAVMGMIPLERKKKVSLLSLANELYIHGLYWEDKNYFFWWEKNVSAAMSDH